MITRYLTNSLALLSTLAVSGAAFARNPPALEQSRRAAAAAEASCPGPELPTAGYRDLYARSPSAPSIAAPPVLETPALHVQDDHLVVSCEAGRVHRAPGYRDADWRTFQAREQEQIARVPSDVLVSRR